MRYVWVVRSAHIEEIDNINLFGSEKKALEFITKYGSENYYLAGRRFLF